MKSVENHLDREFSITIIYFIVNILLSVGISIILVFFNIIFFIVYLFVGFLPSFIYCIKKIKQIIYISSLIENKKNSGELKLLLDEYYNTNKKYPNNKLGVILNVLTLIFFLVMLIWFFYPTNNDSYLRNFDKMLPALALIFTLPVAPAVQFSILSSLKKSQSDYILLMLSWLPLVVTLIISGFVTFSYEIINFVKIVGIVGLIYVILIFKVHQIQKYTLLLYNKEVNAIKEKLNEYIPNKYLKFDIIKVDEKEIIKKNMSKIKEINLPKEEYKNDAKYLEPASKVKFNFEKKEEPAYNDKTVNLDSEVIGEVTDYSNEKK